jgi:Flp pilus assembly pilin Flp
MSLLQKVGEKRQPLNNERGLEIMEAGIYAALVIAGAIAILALIGPQLVTAWTAINTAL